MNQLNRYLPAIAIVIIIAAFIASIFLQSPAVTAAAIFASWPAAYWLGWTNHAGKLAHETEIEQRVMQRLQQQSQVRSKVS